MAEMQEVLAAWQPYLEGLDNWQSLVESVEPKPTGCGPVYELPNPIPGRPNESFAIADMRGMKVTEPHYHPDGEVEIYVVLQGLGNIVVGNKPQALEKGAVVVTPPNTTHYTLPLNNLVLAVINTPPFHPEGYIPITDTDQSKGFDRALFDQLEHQRDVDYGRM